jgi:hypothetical protein
VPTDQIADRYCAIHDVNLLMVPELGVCRYLAEALRYNAHHDDIAARY